MEHLPDDFVPKEGLGNTYLQKLQEMSQYYFKKKKKKDRWGLCIIQAAGRRGKWRIWLSDTNSDERPRTREAKWMQLFNE